MDRALNKSNLLWHAIIELGSLIASKVNAEDSYQKFFERNPIAFTALGFDKAESFEKQSEFSLPYDEDRQYTPEPDFICALTSTGAVTVFELKTPFVDSPLTQRSDGKRMKLRAVLASYVSQTEEYMESIRERAEARVVVKNALSLTDISSYAGAVVYGLIEPNDALKLERLVARKTPPIQVVGFNQVLDALADRYYGVRNDDTSRPGWTFEMTLRLSKTQNKKVAYIMDVGGLVENRVSIYIQDNHIVLRILDRHGSATLARARYHMGMVFNLRVEFSDCPISGFVSCFFNDQEMTYIANPNLEGVELRGTKLIMAADIHGTGNAALDLFHTLVMERTLRPDERLLFTYASRERLQIAAPYLAKRGDETLVNFSG